MKLAIFTLFLSLLNFCVWVFFDYYAFYLISKVKFKINDLFLIGYFILAMMLSLFNMWFSMIAGVVEIIVFYMWFKRRNKKQVILGSTLIVGIIDLFGNVLMNILQIGQSSTIYELVISELTNLVLLLIFIILIYYKKSQLFELLSSKTSNTFLFLIGYFYISVEIFSTLIVIKESKQLIIAALFIILILQSIFISLGFSFDHSISKKRIEIEEQKQLKQYVKNIENYAEYLENNEDGLKKFRHDVKNLLSSVNLKNNEDVYHLSTYIEKYVKENSFEKYKDLNHIKIKLLKNLLLAKISTMIKEKINYSFECTKEINNIPENVNLFDLIRILGIVVDNAIEETKVDKDDPQISMMVFLNERNGIEFEVRNTIKNKDINIAKLQNNGYTTKVNHDGIGLNNVKEIVAKYSNLFLDLHIKDNWFVFYLVIDKE